MYYYPFALHKDKQIDHKYLVYYYILAKKIHEFKIFKQVQKIRCMEQQCTFFSSSVKANIGVVKRYYIPCPNDHSSFKLLHFTLQKYHRNTFAGLSQNLKSVIIMGRFQFSRLVNSDRSTDCTINEAINKGASRSKYRGIALDSHFFGIKNDYCKCFVHQQKAH